MIRGRYTDYIYAFAGRHYAGVYLYKGAEHIKTGRTYRIFAWTNRTSISLSYQYNKIKDRISNSMSVLMWNKGQYQPDWYLNFSGDFRNDYFKMFETETKADIIEKQINNFLSSSFYNVQYGTDRVFF